MRASWTWLLCSLSLLACPAWVSAAEIGIAALVEGNARILRGATWYKLVPGARLETGDIVEAAERAQVHIEFDGVAIVNLVGTGTLHLALTVARSSVPAGPPTLALRNGWLKVAAKAPGIRVRAPPLQLTTTEAILVMHATGPVAELFIESGSARATELLGNGAEGAARDAKAGEYWSKSSGSPFVTVASAPRTFVDAMPRHFLDALPSMAAQHKTTPALVVDHEVTYAEAEPWLDGPDRALFEKRFASRLRDPAFRRAVEPHVARYPSWDRMLHPEKYAPKPPP